MTFCMYDILIAKSGCIFSSIATYYLKRFPFVVSADPHISELKYTIIMIVILEYCGECVCYIRVYLQFFNPNKLATLNKLLKTEYRAVRISKDPL